MNYPVFYPLDKREFLKRQEHLNKMGSVKLDLINSINQIRSNISCFNRDAAFFERSSQLVKQTTYWVYDPDNNIFGPSKFVGFQSMNFTDYEEGISGNTTGTRFHGTSTRERIQEVLLDKEFEADKNLNGLLYSWAHSLFREDVFKNVDSKKWRFITIPDEKKKC